MLELMNYTLFGATTIKANFRDGRASFKDLGLQGIPGSGPYEIYFESFLRVSNTKRLLKTTKFLQTWIKDCSIANAPLMKNVARLVKMTHPLVGTGTSAPASSRNCRLDVMFHSSK